MSKTTQVVKTWITKDKKHAEQSKSIWVDPKIIHSWIDQANDVENTKSTRSTKLFEQTQERTETSYVGAETIRFMLNH